MSAVFKREFRSYFNNPVGYIFLAAMYFFLGLYFLLIYSQGSPDVPQIVYYMSSVILFITPVITMRALSEDRKQKVDQALLTAPVKLSGIVLGKFFAAMAVYAIGFLPTIVFEIIVSTYVQVNLFSYVYMLLGMLLFGGVLIALGIFISSLTESTAISAILTLIINLIVMYLPAFASLVQNSGAGNSKFLSWLVNGFQYVLQKLSITDTLESFSSMIFSIRDVIYLLSFIVVFVFLSVRSLEKRRWA